MRTNRATLLLVVVLVTRAIAGAQAGKPPAGQTLNATSLSAVADNDVTFSVWPAGGLPACAPAIVLVTSTTTKSNVTRFVRMAVS